MTGALPTLAVLGLGASGVAAARLALSQGETVHVSDASNDARLAARGRELEALGAHVELGSHDLDRIAQARLVVVSPGIPPDAPVLRGLRARGVRWVSEPEYAVRFYQGPLIAITGTNGKTTTAVLTAHLLEASGVRAALGGNVGGGIAPAASELALLDPPPDWYVLEVSSFQLADTVTFAPRIGVVTNLGVDHLDRYPDVAAYHADKAQLFRNARETDRWVLNGEDPATLALPGEAPGARYRFRWDPPADACVHEETITLLGDPVLPLGAFALLGRHNAMNALAASLAARLAGAGVEGIREGLRSFRPLPHRLEPVGELGGVLWVNDSKATNVAAAASAIASLDRSIVLLLGGKDKGEDFRPLGELLQGRVREVVVFGEAGARIRAELGGVQGVRLRPVDGGLEEAVRTADGTARPGEVVLLSPACSSFDAFRSYEERGDRFRELVGSRGRGGEA